MPAEPTRVYRGRSVAERHAERRDKFIAAGLEVFGTVGYQQGSISAICSEAGLSRRQFYESFDGREDLLIAVYTHVHAEARHAVVTAYLAADISGDDLNTLARPALAAFFDSMASDVRRMRIAFVEIAGISPRVEDYRLSARANWAAWFAEVARAFSEDQEKARDREKSGNREESGGPYTTESEFGFSYEGAALVGALSECGITWASAEYRPDRDEVVDVLLGVLNGLARRRGL